MPRLRVPHRQRLRRVAARRQSALRVRGCAAASTTRRCRRSRCSSICRRRRSCCRPTGRPRACASSRRRSRCRSPAIRRSAPRTSFARADRRGDDVTLEMRVGHHPGAGARRRLDARRRTRRGIAPWRRRAPSSRRCWGSPRPTSRPIPPRRRCGSTPDRSSSMIPLASADAVRRAAPRADLLQAHGAHGAARDGLRLRADPQPPRRRRNARRRRALLLSQARRGHRGPGHRFRVRESRRLAARDRRAAAAAHWRSRRAMRSAGRAGWVSRSRADRSIRVSGRVIELARGIVSL